MSRPVVLEWFCLYVTPCRVQSLQRPVPRLTAEWNPQADVIVIYCAQSFLDCLLNLRNRTVYCL